MNIINIQINKKLELGKEKISVETYIIKNGVDSENIKIFLDNIFDESISKFFIIYQSQFFKLALEDRIYFQNKFKKIQDIEIPDLIKKNMIEEIDIETILSII